MGISIRFFKITCTYARAKDEISKIVIFQLYFISCTQSLVRKIYKSNQSQGLKWMSAAKKSEQLLCRE